MLKWVLRGHFPRNQDVTVKLKSEIIFNRELVSSGSKSLFVGDLQADKKFFSQKYGSKGQHISSIGN